MLNYQLFGTVFLFLVSAFASFFSQGQQKPDENRFTPVVLIPGGELDEPLNFEVLRDGRVFIQERRTGSVKMYDPTSKLVKLVGTIPVNHTYTSAAGQQREAEEGLVGMTLDPNFEQNGWMYLLYAHPTVEKHVLSRFQVQGDTLVKASEKVLLDYDNQRETCCHTGGGMTWDRQGNLYITIGNNTGNVNTSQTDQRPGRVNWDDQRGAGNTNDLRGKIIKIHPEPDGTYTIPAGNLFPPGTPNTRPEIYAMGLRNAWRPSLDSRTGFLYWGEVGPDAAAATADQVEGYDEFNQARGPGNFGWPYFIGPNRPTPITDYVTGQVVGTKDPARPINDSRHNTGLRELPAARPSFIGYPYAMSEQFPELGTGGRCAVGGPIYHRSDFTNPARPWPAYYEGKWLITDCSRNWIMAVTMDQNSNYQSMERFLPGYRPIEPMDMKFGPDGDLYVLEYGSVWFGKSPDSKLVRIEYNAGNRAPEVEITSNTSGGVVPFNVTLSSEGTRDPDNDALRYEWRVAPVAGGAARTFTTANPSVSFDRPGAYTATLTVRDPAGATASESLRIIAGNDVPAVAVNVTGNRTFHLPNQPIGYAIQVTDREDGTISPNNVAVSIDYVPENFDLSALRQGDRPVDARSRFAVAEAIMATTDCRACHQPDIRSAGPSWTEIATRYANDAEAPARLIAKIRGGGSGVWGEVNMPAHPSISVAEANALVQYIMAATNTAINATPLAGTYPLTIPAGDNGRGSVVVRAAYTDRGAGALPAHTSEQMVVLRSPQVAAGSAEVISNAETMAGGRGAGPLSVLPRPNGYIGFRGIDLTGIRSLNLMATATARENHAGGIIEVREGSPTGQLLGQAEVRGAQQTQGPTATQIQQQGGGGGGGQAAQAGLLVTLPQITGVHDLYFVFKNDQARPTTPLMNLSVIRFNP